MLLCFLQLASFTHQMKDGWGLATDGKILFGSDGSSTLYQIDPQTMKGTGLHFLLFNSFTSRSNIPELLFMCSLFAFLHFHKCHLPSPLPTAKEKE